MSFPEMRFRAPHILSISFPGGVGAFVEALAAEEVYVARRMGRLRISPHVYNDEADIERFIEVFHRFVRQHWVQPMECRAVRS